MANRYNYGYNLVCVRGDEVSYPELQETINVLVNENRDLKGKPYLRDELLGCLALVSSELVQHLTGTDIGFSSKLQNLISNVEYVLKQLPDDIRY